MWVRSSTRGTSERIFVYHGFIQHALKSSSSIIEYTSSSSVKFTYTVKRLSLLISLDVNFSNSFISRSTRFQSCRNLTIRLRHLNWGRITARTKPSLCRGSGQTERDWSCRNQVPRAERVKTSLRSRFKRSDRCCTLNPNRVFGFKPKENQNIMDFPVTQQIIQHIDEPVNAMAALLPRPEPKPILNGGFCWSYPVESARR